MSSYLIKLMPTGRYFFGGDARFQVNPNKKDEQYESYIIFSNKMPQQTSLLGMLRFLLLRNAGEGIWDSANQRIANVEDARKLIGGSSFEVNGNKTDFGYIKSLTPCFVFGVDKPKSRVAEFDNEKTRAGRYYFNGGEQTVPVFEGFDAKKYDYSLYPSDTFIEDRRVGISRDHKTGKVEEDCFFSQVFYRLKDGCSFAFYADVDSVDLSAYNNQLVSVGGDSSSFVFSAEKAEYTCFFEPSKTPYTITLASPSYIDNDTVKLSRFAVTNTLALRFMQTTVKTKSYNRLSGEIKPSIKFCLYDAGSVFYFENEAQANDFRNKVEGRADFHQIGYNYCCK